MLEAALFSQKVGPSFDFLTFVFYFCWIQKTECIPVPVPRRQKVCVLRSGLFQIHIKIKLVVIARP
jgi:hypothetical protein